MIDMLVFIAKHFLPFFFPSYHSFIHYFIISYTYGSGVYKYSLFVLYTHSGTKVRKTDRRAKKERILCIFCTNHFTECTCVCVLYNYSFSSSSSSSFSYRSCALSFLHFFGIQFISQRKEEEKHSRKVSLCYSQLETMFTLVNFQFCPLFVANDAFKVQSSVDIINIFAGFSFSLRLVLFLSVSLPGPILGRKSKRLYSAKVPQGRFCRY